MCVRACGRAGARAGRRAGVRCMFEYWLEHHHRHFITTTHKGLSFPQAQIGYWQRQNSCIGYSNVIP
jgi:hypothetical protein